MKHFLGPIVGFLVIGCFVANMVYLHVAIRDCVAQNAPGETHDWSAIIKAMVQK